MQLFIRHHAQGVSPTTAGREFLARAMVRDVSGSEGVHISVACAGTKTADKPKNVGQVHGTQSAWTTSNPFNVHPGNLPGWQLVQFTLSPGGKSSNFQISNFWVDPRMGR